MCLARNVTCRKCARKGQRCHSADCRWYLSKHVAFTVIGDVSQISFFTSCDKIHVKTMQCRVFLLLCPWILQEQNSRILHFTLEVCYQYLDMLLIACWQHRMKKLCVFRYLIESSIYINPFHILCFYASPPPLSVRDF